MTQDRSARCFVVMGVSGCGKTTIAESLATAADGVYIDGDDFHPPENRAKMQSGIPLDDEDRRPWLEALNARMRRHMDKGQGPLFLACSALKEVYREQLRHEVPLIQFLYLNGSRELILERMKARDHFMPPELLDSQLETLELPEKAIWYDIIDPVEVILEKFFRQFPEWKHPGSPQ